MAEEWSLIVDREDSRDIYTIDEVLQSDLPWLHSLARVMSARLVHGQPPYQANDNYFNVENLCGLRILLRKLGYSDKLVVADAATHPWVA